MQAPDNMKSLKLYVMALALFFFSCETKTKNSDVRSKLADTVSVIDNVNLTEIKEIQVQDESSLNENKVSTKADVLPKLFSFENTVLSQTIELDLLTEDSLKFKLISESKLEQKTSEIEGIAILKDGVESDEDENGRGYLCEEFLYEKDCWLAIRIDMEDKDKLKVLEADCEGFRHPGCPFESVNVMRPIRE